MFRRNYSIKQIFGEHGQVLGESYAAIVPTTWESQQQKQITTSQSQTEQFDQAIQAFQVFAQDSKDLKTSFDAMTATYMLLQKKLDEKDQEIKDLREGYGLRIYKRFLRQFVEINQQVNLYIRDRQFEEQNFKDIEYLLADALEEAGVECFTPAVGAVYGVTDGVEDNPKQVETEDPERDRTIKEVLDEGYRLETTKEVIQKAKVSVYVCLNPGGE
jgi:molecular chaperone GrpE (heat shock protein)